ncbi:MAG: sulfatase/phosphatase domain-containing protein [Thermogemmata sp.]
MKVILFLLRGCHAGWLGTYGNEWVGTPHCDRLAYEGIVWDRYYADQVDPLHQRQRLISLVRTLRTGGVTTALVRAHAPVHDFPASFYEPWEYLFDARPEVGHSPLRPFVEHWPSILNQLANDRHFFLCVDLGRLLPPWEVPLDVFTAYLDLEEAAAADVRDEAEQAAAGEDVPSSTSPPQEHDDAARVEDISPCTEPPVGPFDTTDEAAWQWLHASFAAVVTTWDAEIGAAWDYLRQHPLQQEALWILTSDLGFPLGEHGRVGWDRPWLYEEVVHLPLIIRLPGADQGGRRVSALTQSADLLATLADAFLGLVQPSLEGQSLLPLLQRQAFSGRQEVISYWEMEYAAEVALRTDTWSFLWPIRTPAGEERWPQLYAKPEDRWEVNDLRSRQLTQAEIYEARLREWIQEHMPHLA